MVRQLQILLIAVTALTTACSTLRHAEAKIQAQERWSAARAEIKYRLARQHYERGGLEDALRDGTEAVILDRKHIPSYVLVARANLELGKIASAEQALDAAGHAGLDSADLRYTRGVVLEQRGLFDAAEAAYTQALRLDPTNVDFAVALAECLVSQGRPAEAMAVLDGEARRADDDGTIPILSAHVAALMGRADEALDRLYQARRKNPDSRMIAEELGRHLAQGGRCEEALGLLQPLIESEPDTQVAASTLRAVATCHLALGDAASAKATLLHFGRDGDKNAAVQILLAKAALATNDIRTARRAIELAYQSKPNAPEVRLVRAAVRWKRGDLAGAAANLREMLAANNNDVEAHCLLAEVLRSDHQNSAARKQFQLALLLDSDCAWATAGLRSLNAARHTPQEPRSPAW